MSSQWNRRDVLRGLTAISTAALVPLSNAPGSQADPQIEVQATPVTAHTLRLSLVPAADTSKSIPSDGSLIKESWGTPVRATRQATNNEISIANFRLKISWSPLSIAIADEQEKLIQQFDWNSDTNVLSFLTGTSPLLGLGEGGQQFDRRGSTDAMRSGQGGYKLATHGGRVPIPWIVSTSGWAIFFHQPFGTFDFTSSVIKFQASSEDALPLDLFFVASR